MSFPVLFFLKKIILAIWGPLRFYVNFRMGFSIFAKKITALLIGIALNLYTALGSFGILTILTVPIHEYGMCLHLSSVL